MEKSKSTYSASDWDRKLETHKIQSCILMVQKQIPPLFPFPITSFVINWCRNHRLPSFPSCCFVEPNTTVHGTISLNCASVHYIGCMTFKNIHHYTFFNSSSSSIFHNNIIWIALIIFRRDKLFLSILINDTSRNILPLIWIPKFTSATAHRGQTLDSRLIIDR